MKLLNYTSIRYLLFAALLLIISVPVFYFALNKIFISSIDKELNEHAKELVTDVYIIESQQDLDVWRALDNDLEILNADSTIFHDEPFTTIKASADSDKQESIRVVQKRVNILGHKYIIQTESSLVHKDTIVKTILLIQLSIFFLLLFGAAIINYLINKKVWRPFYENLNALQHFDIDSSDFHEPNHEKIIEFNQLNTSIHQLFTRVRKTYLSQKEFIENASHELQTPLTVLKFKLELLLQEKNLSNNQGNLINDMYKEIEQMEELNNNLLLLSKIENRQFTNTENVSINEVVKETINDLWLIAESKSQKIVETFETEINLQSNKNLLKILIKNLILNALQYSNEKAIINILIDDNFLTISNPGNPLKVPQDKLFRRFNKNISNKGNGLGLSIVKSISDLYGYKIMYEYKNTHHYFVLHFN